MTFVWWYRHNYNRRKLYYSSMDMKLCVCLNINSIVLETVEMKFFTVKLIKEKLDWLHNNTLHDMIHIYCKQ